MKLQQAPQRLMVVVAWIALVSCGVLRAQYSSASFDLKKASDLYDERGFQRNKAITVDGKLVVAESNGNVSYSYPISEHTVNGFALKVKLNYCGSVGFTAFKDYYTGAALSTEELIPHITNPGQRWAKFHQNRPAWILGVNGFAIQALATSSAFHMDPAIVSASGFDDRLWFSDSDFVWCIDGYDFCNRMKNIGNEDYTDGGAKHDFVDCIRLLRDDGSVLQLINAKRSDTSQWGVWNDSMYIGYYVPNETNPHGFALVEYIDDGMPGYLANYATSYTNPRRVRYYPGDGMEYVFEEVVVPFGTAEYRQTAATYGGAKAGPTIFYLEEINSSAGEITRFRRSRQRTSFTPGDELFGADSTKGRAVVTQFDGHTINYSNSGLLIEALGRTIVARIGPISKSGNTGAETKMPLARDADFAMNSVSWARLGIDQSDQYHSYLGYVSEIVDPEGRKTTFDYEPYTKIYTGSGFPVSNSSAHIMLDNWRLKEVHEPTVTYVLDYYSWDPLHADPTPSDTAVVYSTTKDLYKLQYPLNDYRKYEGGTLLTTDRYVYEMSGVDDKYFSKSTHSIVDEVAGDSVTNTTYYRRSWMPSFIPYLPPVVHTEMYRVDQDAPGYSSSRISHDDSLAVLVRLPDSISQTVNGINKQTQINSYTLERVRHFGGDSTLAEWFGSEVAMKTESYKCACLNCDSNDTDSTTYRRLETHYLNLPFIDSTVSYVDTLRLNKFATLERFRQLKAAGTIDGEWEDMMYDPEVFVGVHDTLQLRVPPWSGLVSQTTEGDMVAGINRTHYNIYQTEYTGEYNGTPRGFLLRDSSAGGTINGTQKGMAGNRRVYVRTRGHILLDSTVNANGAVSQSFYKYRYESDTLRHADAALEPYALKGRELDLFGRVDTIDLNNREDLTYLLEQPSVGRMYVRTADPSAPGGIGLRTIDQYQELTYYGLSRRSVDANGWCSEFEYDADGRLLTAWLPHDYPRLDSFYVIQETGYEEFDVIGTSLVKWAYDTLYCDQNCQPSGYALTPGSWTNYDERLLYADNPTVPQYDCYGEIVPISNKGKSGAATQRACSAPLPYVHPEPTGLTLYLWVNKIDTLSAVSIDSAWIRLYIGAISDTCMNVEFSRDDWNFSQTYSLNCPLSPPNSNQSDGKRGASPQTTGEGVYLDEQGREYLLVDLSSRIGALLDSAASGAPFVTIDVNVTTEGGHISFLSGVEGIDVRPRLVLKGTFDRKHRFEDYTLKYSYDDTTLSSTVLAKIDDSLHSSNVIDWATYNTNRRVTKGVYRFGADYRVKSAQSYIDDANTPTRIDSVVSGYTGNGRRKRVRDQDGDSILTRYDALSRPVETINGDRTHTTISYLYGRQETFGIDQQDQRFPCAYVAVTVSSREDSVKFVKYEDAFGKVRREVSDSGGMNLTTRYDYDYLGQLRQVVNPKGDTTRYWYDEFGRVRYKHQPDLGYISYAYDDVGNIRFTQTQAQADSGRMTFDEYDDLNRLVLVGEMIEQTYAEDDTTIHYGIAPDGGVTGGPRRAGSSHGDIGKSGARVQTDGDELGLNRLSDLANPRQLNTGGASSILTANPTIWMTSAFTVPKVRPDSVCWIAPCQLGPNMLLGDTSMPMPPYLAAPVGITSFYDPRKGPGATLYDFEHTAQYPHFPRMAISYDTLPLRQGPIWGNFPAYAKWDSIAPKGKIRNMTGREVAVAYREHGGEPYHYTVLSFDERGRVEALLRYTENLGFDAIYYTYNSMNQATAVRIADPFRQYTSWYGYDGNGRVDSVWTKLDDVGSGLLTILPSMRADSLKRPLSYRRSDSVSDADISYSYTPSNQVSMLRYPGQSIQVQYSYDHRKRLTTIASSHYPTFLGWVFREDLTYDSTGQIVKQRSRGWGSSSWLTQNYLYDPIQRLTGWKASTLTDTTFYTYDDVGNRTYEVAGGVNTLSMYTVSQTPNRLQTTVRTDPFLPNPSRTDYGYNLNGSVVDRNYYTVTGQGLISTGEDHFAYSYRELNRQYVTGDPTTNSHTDWRYRYNAMGEREQKRMYHHPTGDEVPYNAYPWVYYILGGTKEQLSVWAGQQTSQAVCGNPGRTVFMYPTEYLTYGVSLSALLTMRPNGEKEYKVLDHLGSTRAIIDDGGSIGWFQDYEPFGKVLAGGAETRKGYIGIETDGESELQNLGIRQYDPIRSNFLSADPLWEKFPNQSPYVYGSNNPLRVVDQSGLAGDSVVPEGGGELDPEPPPDPAPEPTSSGAGLPEHESLTPEGESAPPDPIDITPATQEEIDKANEQQARQNPWGKMEGNSRPPQTFNLNPRVPPQAIDVLRQVEAKNGAPPNGYKGGRIYENRDGQLPQGGAYREYDIYPHVQGVNRGTERIVRDANSGNAWYTNDHYQTFTLIRK